MNYIYLGLILFIGFSYTSADVSHITSRINNSTDLPVTDVCLGCICEATSGCDRSLKCNGDVCGLFKITWAYWADGGKPTQQGQTPESPNAYDNCVNEPFCAARTIQNYMKRYGQDCNNDGKVDCIDYAKIHIFGGYGCQGELNYKYKTAFDNCINYFLTQ